MTHTWDLAELRSHYQQLLRATDRPSETGIRPARAKTNDPEQVARLIQAAEAAEALAMIAAYTSVVGLSTGPANWTMSCLPHWSGVPGIRRATTISIARDEVFYVWMNVATGAVEDWAARVEASFAQSARNGTSAWRTMEPSKHGVFAYGWGFSSFETFIGREDARDSMAALITAVRRSSAPRQTAWHNPALASLVDLADVGPREASWDVPVGYVLRAHWQRLHARATRRNLLADRKHECQVCGLDRVNVLEAAHIVADAAGGKSNSENMLLLCANHHRAMDAGMFTWTGEGADPDAYARWEIEAQAF